ncbi:cell envelope integrity protein CreD [Entomohabitans teleogrylli]|uniref:cell envelope integrity protein CreD n=1 Tax=Entomohabitans teleogrylli TaxID=1384589 RepID=UPI00073D3730|nr:cell envelope integrity protein CreD [Entomohabitans teleogrylli]
MLKSPLLLKMVALLGCMLLLLVPLSMLRGLINERADYRESVDQSLSQSTSGAQKLVGPLIAIPVTRLTTVLENDKTVTRERTSIYYWLPESLIVQGNQDVENRNIGIYQGQIWNNALEMKARFDTSRLKDIQGLRRGKPWVTFAVSDSRGIGHVGALTINGQTLDIEPGSGLSQGDAGIHAMLAEEALEAKQLDVALSMTLKGTGEFALVPVGRNSELALISNWPHPGFLGNFLPEKRDISPSGFSAQWKSSWLANNLDSRFSASKLQQLPAFSVMTATPVDQYQLTDRAVKYAVLLIALTYMAFFVFETLTAQRLHPVQYLLVGTSLVMFYLVLLALSEHVGFNLAWLIACLACVGLNGVYLQGILKSPKSSLAFSAGLLALYGVLWLLLRSEESALLLGSLVLFVALSVIMVLTRHFDWYAVTLPKGKVLAGTENGDDDRLRLWE